MNIYPTVYDCTIIELPTIKNRAGNISIAEGTKQPPFEIKRIFYLFDIPAGVERGAHAHRECHQLLIAASGSFEIKLVDGQNDRIVILNRPFRGLHIPPGIWAQELNFSSGAICLVLTSHKFNEIDYIRNYDEFLNYRIGLL